MRKILFRSISSQYGMLVFVFLHFLEVVSGLVAVPTASAKAGLAKEQDDCDRTNRKTHLDRDASAIDKDELKLPARRGDLQLELRCHPSGSPRAKDGSVGNSSNELSVLKSL